MSTDELFIDGNKLPKILPKSQIYELLDKVKQGDKDATKMIVEHNIRLVLHQVSNRFKFIEYDKKDLVSTGIIGLIKAVTTYDKSKKFEFSTYAARCIDNEILMFLRNLKKDEKVDSFDKAIAYDKEGKELKIENTISDGTNIIEDYEKNITYKIIREIVKKLPDKDREIITLHFGFYNNKIHTQKEIANIMSISQSQVSRIITKTVKNIGIQLQNCGIIESTRKINKKGTKINETAPQLSTTTPIPNIQSQEKIKSMNPNRETLDKSNVNFDERNLIKMKEERTESELISSKFKDSKLSLLQTTSEIEKDDCLKILKLTKTPSFGETLKSI